MSNDLLDMFNDMDSQDDDKTRELKARINSLEIELVLSRTSMKAEIDRAVKGSVAMSETHNKLKSLEAEFHRYKKETQKIHDENTRLQDVLAGFESDIDKQLKLCGIEYEFEKDELVLETALSKKIRLLVPLEVGVLSKLNSAVKIRKQQLSELNSEYEIIDDRIKKKWDDFNRVSEAREQAQVSEMTQAMNDIQVLKNNIQKAHDEDEAIELLKVMTDEASKEIDKRVKQLSDWFNESMARMDEYKSSLVNSIGLQTPLVKRKCKHNPVPQEGEKKFNIVYRTHFPTIGKEYIGRHSTDVLGDNYWGSGAEVKALPDSDKQWSITEVLYYGSSMEEVKIMESLMLTPAYLASDRTLNISAGVKLDKRNQWLVDKLTVAAQLDIVPLDDIDYVPSFYKRGGYKEDWSIDRIRNRVYDLKHISDGFKEYQLDSFARLKDIFGRNKYGDLKF